MTGFGPEANALLEASRCGDEPTDADRERVRAGIAKRLATGAAAGLGAAAIQRWIGSAFRSVRGAKVATAAAGQFATKALLAAGLVGLVGASAGVAAHSLRHPEKQAVSAPAGPAVRAPVEAVVPAPPPGPPQDKALAESPPASRPTTAPSPANAIIASTKRVVANQGEVAAEVRLLDEAQAAIRGGDPQRALTLLEEHARRYSKGALGEEREAARVAALCALGRTAEARAATERFMRASPSSPLAGPLQASCGAPAKRP